MYILVRLNPNQGINLGPNFTLTANVGTLVPATATLTQLLAGVSVLADNAVTQVTVTSQGVCTNSLILSVVQPTTTTTSTTSTTTTTTTIAPILCFNYTVYADDGTNDRESYPFSYISCAGATVNNQLVNLDSTTVCAREGSVTGGSAIFDVQGTSCVSATTTTTTTTEPPTVYRYSATRCSTGATVNIVSPVTLSPGTTYSNQSSTRGECYTVIAFVETTIDPATVYYSLASDPNGTDCSNSVRCFQG